MHVVTRDIRVRASDKIFPWNVFPPTNRTSFVFILFIKKDTIRVQRAKTTNKKQKEWMYICI